MCFGSPAKPKEPPPPPTERDASLTANRKRQQQAAGGGLDSTLKTSPLGVPDTGGTKTTLGG